MADLQSAAGVFAFADAFSKAVHRAEAEQAVFRCDDEFEAAAAIRALKGKEPGQ